MVIIIVPMLETTGLVGNWSTLLIDFNLFYYSSTIKFPRAIAFYGINNGVPAS